MRWVIRGVEVVAILSVMLWGVPYYVDIKVEERVNQLDDAAEPPQEITRLESDVAAMKETINDIQSDVSGIRTDLASTRSDNAQFQSAVIRLLERQAN